jgi:hypothetical protein
MAEDRNRPAIVSTTGQEACVFPAIFRTKAAIVSLEIEQLPPEKPGNRDRPLHEDNIAPMQ